MYSQQGMPLLPQLGPAHMGGTHMGMSYMAAPQALQQPFGPPQGLQGPHQTNTRRGPGRQAGSALPFPGIGNAPDPFSNYAVQQQQQQAGMMQNWGSPFAAAQQPFPAQYAQSAASMGQAMPNGFAGYSPAASGGYPGVQSTGMLPRRAKAKGNVFGQPSMQQSYAAGPMAAAMPPVGYPNQPMPFAGGMTQMGGVPQQVGGPMPWGNGAAMQQRADGMQQYQLQQHLQMQNNIMQQLQQNQNHALLKYGNFDAATYKQSDLKSRPEFRTY